MSESSGDSVCCCGAERMCADTDGRLPASHVDYVAECATNVEVRALAIEVLERRTLDAKRRCATCVQRTSLTYGNSWPESCALHDMVIDPDADWFCADWEEPK